MILSFLYAVLADYFISFLEPVKEKMKEKQIEREKKKERDKEKEQEKDEAKKTHKLVNQIKRENGDMKLLQKGKAVFLIALIEISQKE